jgi:hypothetical protein
MATATFSVPAQITSDAEFRTWGSSINTALAALGLVQTGDTGQINWTTVTKPVAATTFAGYEIWRFNDTLQATAPVYIKIEYGTGSSGASWHGLAVTVGSGTNGAGTINGQVGTRKVMSLQSSTATSATNHLSGANNRLQMCLNSGQDNISYGMLVAIERSKDSSGADDGTGISTFISGAPGSTSSQISQDQFIPYLGLVPAVETGPCVAMPGNAITSAVFGADVGVFPQFPVLGKALNPKLGLLSAKKIDIADLSTISVSLYGTAHTYLHLGQNVQGASAASKPDNQASLLMRYE